MDVRVRLLYLRHRQDTRVSLQPDPVSYAVCHVSKYNLLSETGINTCDHVGLDIWRSNRPLATALLQPIQGSVRKRIDKTVALAILL